MRTAADGGSAVVVLSSDVLELQGLCDRVLVFSRGRIVAALEVRAITEENITGAAVTSDGEHQSGGQRSRRTSCISVRRFLAGDYLPSLVLAVLIVALPWPPPRQRPLPLQLQPP